MPNDQVTLRVGARPVRILSLVNNREDITRSVRLFTHLWGGAANAILPVPTGERQSAELQAAIARHNPDLVLSPQGGISDELESQLLSVPYYLDSLTDPYVHEHLEGLNLFRFRKGKLAHLDQVLHWLFPIPFPEASNLRLVQPGSPHEFELAMHYGLPSEGHARYLQRSFRAGQLNAPQSYPELLKSILIAGERLTPRAITLSNARGSVSNLAFQTRTQTPITSMRVSRQQTLFLFLDDGATLGVPCAFWNARSAGNESNKLFLPRGLFLDDMDTTLKTISSVHRFDELIVLTPATEAEAEDLRDRLDKALVAAGIEATVAVYFDNFEYELGGGRFRIAAPEVTTKTADAEGVIRFTPSAPFAAEIDTVFGYDAAVEYLSGAKLSLPSADWTSILLQNSMDRILRAERNEAGHGAIWLRGSGAPETRAVPEGIAGVTLPGEECQLHLHQDDVVIGQLLKARGLRIEPNPHTLYAAGFGRRFGGLAKTLSLVRQGGAQIIRALSTEKASQCGLSAQQMVGLLHERYNMSQQDAKKLLDAKLPELCAAELVRRGAALKCKHCGLTDWYPVNALAEFIECNGCGQKFQLQAPGIREYAYKANELSRRLIKEGGTAVLMTAAGLRRIELSGALQFGGDVFRQGERKNFAEIDLILLTATTTAVAECKDYVVIRDDDVPEIIASLEKNVVAAVDIGAHVLLLGITSAIVPPAVFEAVRRLSDQIKPLGIALHMFVNGEFHYECADQVTEARSVSIERLKLPEPSEPLNNYVGSVRPGIGFGFTAKEAPEDLIKKWEQELGAG